MKISIVTDIKNLHIDRETWNTIAAENTTNTIFQTYEWFHSWWETFGNEYKLVFVLVEDEKGLRGFAPLMIHAPKSGEAVLRFACDVNADYCDFIIRGNRLEVIEHIIDKLLLTNLGCNHILLKNIPDYSTTTACIKTVFTSRKLYLRSLKPTPTPTLIIRNHEEDAQRIANKYSVLRHFRKLKKSGHLEFKNITNFDTPYALENIGLFFDQHVQRYSFKKDESLFLNMKNRLFYKKLIDNMKDKDWILFSVLEYNESPIAYHFGFLYNNTLIWYKPAFDISIKSKSPGTIMLKMLIEYAITNGADELDYTIGNESFKKRFSNHVRQNNHIWIGRKKKDFYLKCLRTIVSGLIQRFIKSSSN